MADNKNLTLSTAEEQNISPNSSELVESEQSLPGGSEEKIKKISQEAEGPETCALDREVTGWRTS